MTVCFTGHRPSKLSGGYDYYHPDNIKIGMYLRQEILKLIARGANEFIVGGALGVDQLAFMVLYKLQQTTHPNIQIEVAVPFEQQDSNWITENRETYRNQLRCADVVTYVDEVSEYEIPELKSGTYAPAKMQKRNEYMVDLSDVVVAVWDGTFGGTANCVKYAQSLNKEIIYIKP